MGVVIHDATGTQVAPTSDMQSPAYLAWIAWCEAGNSPTECHDDPDPLQAAFDLGAYEAMCRDAVQQHIDDVARSNGDYDNGLSLAGYATSKHPVRGPVARAFVDWRDAVWDTSASIRDAVLAGQRMPPSVEELMAELPVFVRPQV